jgi:hypothetical protein
MHLIWMAARNDALFLAYLVAIPCSVLFQVEKGVFHRMAEFVEMLIIRPWLYPVLPR